jgi:hypothetical protein
MSICKVTLDERRVAAFEEAVKRQYWFELFIDDVGRGHFSAQGSSPGTAASRGASPASYCVRPERVGMAGRAEELREQLRGVSSSPESEAPTCLSRLLGMAPSSRRLAPAEHIVARQPGC